jgi:hypothetical protein
MPVLWNISEQNIRIIIKVSANVSQKYVYECLVGKIKKYKFLIPILEKELYGITYETYKSGWFQIPS